MISNAIDNRSWLCWRGVCLEIDHDRLGFADRSAHGEIQFLPSVGCPGFQHGEGKGQLGRCEAEMLPPPPKCSQPVMARASGAAVSSFPKSSSTEYGLAKPRSCGSRSSTGES